MKESIEKIVKEFENLNAADQVTVFNEVRGYLIKSRMERYAGMLNDRDNITKLAEDVDKGTANIAGSLPAGN